VSEAWPDRAGGSHTHPCGYDRLVRATTAGGRAQTQERRGTRQELLLDTVERLLADRSFRDLTVAEVMAEADLPRTTFYRYFPDLEAILLLGVARVSAELGDAAALWLNDVTDPVASLRPSAAALIEVYVAHSRLFLAFAEAAASAPAVERAWQDALGGFVDLATARIEELAAAGRSDLEHPRATATALIWMTERFLLQTYGHEPQLPVSTAVDVLELVWRRTLFP